MKTLYSWEWQKKFVPPEVQRKRKHLVNITSVSLTDPEREGDVSRYRTHPLCLITGDGRCLPDNVKEFESWDVPHDLYCVNRSMLYFERQVDHGGAIDIEEAAWFTQHVNEKIQGKKNIIRHTIGSQTYAYDVYWQMDFDFKNDFQRRVLTGNSGYFAVLTALVMGYEKIVLAGIPLNMDSCWYEDEMEDGPNWNGWCYTQWMDFAIKVPRAADVKSLEGYSAFILGKATKDWAKC